MNIKKSCDTCLALITVCGLNCPGAFASSKSLDEIEMFSRHKRRRHNAIVIPEDELRVVFTDYKEVESAFKASKMKGSAEEEPKMKKVIISEGVETIGREAFYERDDIDEVIIPESVKYIDDYAFANCVNLNNIVIKGEVAIGEHSFEGCENLIEISIKGKINSI